MESIYLRFTVDADDDMSRGFSYDILEESEVEELLERYDANSRPSLVGKTIYGKDIISVGDDLATACGEGGLCGHLLESDNIADAIAEVAAKNANGVGWYMNADAQPWVLFSGTESGVLVYADGDCFSPIKILYRSENA